MQADLDAITNAGDAITFKDRDGNDVQLDKSTARHFNETRSDRVLYVHDGHWEKKKDVNTTATSYDGHWVYKVFIYVKANARDEDDYSDYQEVQNAMTALLKELIQSDVDWKLGEDDYYEAQVGEREMIAAEIDIKRFETRRF